MLFFKISSPMMRQTWTMSAVLILMFAQGMTLGYQSSLLPALIHPESPIIIDVHMASWLGSISGIAGILGLLIASLLMDIYGRKIANAVVILPAFIGRLCVYFANDFTTLMIGQFLIGVNGTASLSLGVIVIGEYTSPQNRGVFLYLKSACVCLGVTTIHALTGILKWRIISLVILIPIIVALVIICTWPESPAWLASKQQSEKSEKAFFWLRGKTEITCKEFEDTVKAQTEQVSKSIQVFSYIGITQFLKKFSQKDFLKPCAIVMLATIVLEMSGRHVFPAYALVIMSEITGETNDSFYYTLAIDLITTISIVVATFLAKIIKRRTLLFSTGFLALVILMLVCTYLVLVAKNIISIDHSWIGISLLILYFILANLGCAPVPLALAGEVFPLAHRGVGSALYGIWASLCFMICLQSTPYLLLTIKVYGFFAVYGIIMGVALFILYFIMPETKDRTLQEIENYFKHGTFTDDGNEKSDARTRL